MLKHIVKKGDIQHGRVSSLLTIVEVVPPAAGPTGEAEAEAPGRWIGEEGAGVGVMG